MNVRTSFLLLAAVLVAGGCGHTNNLAKYNLAGSTALYRAYTSGSAHTYAGIQNPASKNVISGIIAAIGSGIVSEEGRKKLERAVVADTIAGAVARGMQQATTDYLSLRPVASVADDPEYLIETELTEYTLVSLSEGLFMRVKGKSRVIHRKTGAIVWENSESHTVPLSETYLAGLAPAPIASGVSIFNAVRLLTLTEQEIATVVNQAATQAGREIGETLREDVAGLHGGK
jgi:hypothetical protein